MNCFYNKTESSMTPAGINRIPLYYFLLCLMLCLFLNPAWAEPGVKNKDISRLDKILSSPHRNPDFMQRDQYRHPKETLTFFEVRSDHSVVEIWPGGGWYAEILAPFLRDTGTYYSAGFSLTAKRTPQWRKNFAKKLLEKFRAQPDIYNQAIITSLAIPEDPQIAPDNSADRVLTFRNVHNWMKGGYDLEVFQSMFKALKPGGVLGVVEHRAKPGTSIDAMIKSGYVTEDYVISMAEKVGFKFIAKSDINQNVKDTTNHPKGVWTLPPSLRLKEEKREFYLSIGESDRMTLKFIKPM